MTWAYIPLSQGEAQRLYQVALEYERSVNERFHLLVAAHGIERAEQVLTSAAGAKSQAFDALWGAWGNRAFPATDHKRTEA